MFEYWGLHIVMGCQKLTWKLAIWGFKIKSNHILGLECTKLYKTTIFPIYWNTFLYLKIHALKSIKLFNYWCWNLIKTENKKDWEFLMLRCVLYVNNTISPNPHYFDFISIVSRMNDMALNNLRIAKFLKNLLVQQ